MRVSVVLDTNVLVSALYSKDGAPARVLSFVLSGYLVPCYDFRILEEYRDVLYRPKFCFPKHLVDDLLSWIECNGVSVVAEPLDASFIDGSDKKFLEVAKTCFAILVTGNMKRFPQDSSVVAVKDFLEKISSSPNAWH